jgi:predicted AAA+ superfamily ATPase
MITQNLIAEVIDNQNLAWIKKESGVRRQKLSKIKIHDNFVCVITGLGKELFYFNEKNECDFIVFENGKIQEAVQVCYEINEDNLKREIAGLNEALNFFGLKKGLIITFNQSDVYRMENKEIKLVPMRELDSSIFLVRKK